MASNTDPVEARIAQDVEPIERRSSIGATHVGRGGAANVATKAPEEAEAEAAAAKEKGGSSSEEHKKAHHHGLAEKAKGLFKKA